MSGSREFLAAVSALCGLILLVLAARGVSRRKARSSARIAAAGLYGLLFVLAGVVLWMRGENGRLGVSVAPRTELQVTEPSMQAESGGAADQSPGAQAGQVSGLNAQSGDVSVDPLPAPHLTEGRRIPPSPPQGKSHESGAGRKRSPDRQMTPASPDERLAAAVLRAFDAIELWFMRHGSSRVASTGGNLSGASRHGQLELPEIIFLGQTAELTAEGAHRLRQLAGRLRSLPDSGVIEIHTQTNDGDPTPFPFMLTQARAEVVRDFLMTEGLRNFRLVAQAERPDGEDSTKAGPQVRLVFRP